MKPENIFIIRHGESEGNVNKQIYKEKPDFALNLTEKGKQQARDAGKKLYSIIRDNPMAVYYSSFFRTIQTLNHIGESVNKNTWIPEWVREDPRLREQEWHGKLPISGFDEDAEEERDKFSTFYFRFTNGGESCADVFDRMSDFLSTLNRDFQNPRFPKHCLLVMHGMSMRLFLMRFFHKRVAEFETWNNPHNCEIFHLKLNEHCKYDFDFNTLRKKTVLHEHRCDLTIL